MNAITQEVYGTPEVLRLREIAVPYLEDHQILIKVHASSVNAAEWHMTTGLPYLVRPSMGFTKPKNETPGADVAGVVESVGNDVSEYKPGDRVFGEIGGGTFGPNTHVAPRRHWPIFLTESHSNRRGQSASPDSRRFRVSWIMVEWTPVTTS